ncbi:MAG: 6-bladed beta-propeller [Balneola sp.]|nr:MAG: 6-bladed beta-propeller [Balneola sp.]
MRLLFLILSVFILSCKNEHSVPGYVSELELDSFDYIGLTVSDEVINSDTLVFESLYDIETANGSDPISNFPVDIGKVGEQYWILDVRGGAIHVYEANGEYVKTIAQKGKGPNELLKPASINTIVENQEQIRIFVLDTGLSSLIEYDKHGKEIDRTVSEFINTNYWSLDLVNGDNNTFFIQQSPYKDSLLIQIDTEAKLVNKFIPRITPLNDSYISHNRITHDYNDTQRMLTYGFKGLPLIFIVTESEKYVFNLLPDKELTEFNKPFMRKTKTSFTGNANDLIGQGINIILHDLSITKEKIYFSYMGKLHSIDLATKKVTKYILVESTGDPISGFTRLKIRDNEIFLINSVKKKIHKSFIN